MPLWRRSPVPPANESVGEFLAAVQALAADEWAFVLRASARHWGGEPLREETVSAAMAADPDIQPFFDLFRRPDSVVRGVIEAASDARRLSRLDETLDVMFPPIERYKNPEPGIRLIWLADTLTKTGAIALARQSQLPRASVVAALEPFSKVISTVRKYVVDQSAMAIASRNPERARTVLIATSAREEGEQLWDWLAETPGINVVALAKDGVAAIEEARAKRPDLVFMEVPLPMKGGITAAPELMSLLPSVLVVLILADNSAGALRNAAQDAATKLLVRPVARSDLQECLSALLRRLDESREAALD